WPSLRLRCSSIRKQASTSSLGSGTPEPVTNIQPRTGGAMKSIFPPANPSAREHGRGLWRPSADWTERTFLLLMASQQPGRCEKQGCWHEKPESERERGGSTAPPARR